MDNGKNRCMAMDPAKARAILEALMGQGSSERLVREYREAGQVKRRSWLQALISRASKYDPNQKSLF